MRVLKFGGQSQASDTALQQVIQIIREEPTPPVVILSARGKTTDALIQLAELARVGKPYQAELQQLILAQRSEADISREIEVLTQTLQGVALLKECSPKSLDKILAFGELVAVKSLVATLHRLGMKALAIDSGDLFVTNEAYGEAEIIPQASQDKCLDYFRQIPEGTIAVITGFIARSSSGYRTTLGRNGSNYSAALLANYLGAEQMDNYTHVDGIYTAHPDMVLDAQKIEELSYTEAAELSQFGASILHYKTIDPLREKGIPLRILNTFAPERSRQKGTSVTAHPTAKGIKALAALPGKAFIHFEQYEMKGRVGIDARIFTALERYNISTSMVAQGSSERGMGIVVEADEAELALEALRDEFREELASGLTTALFAEKGKAVVALVGVDLAHFDRPYAALVANRIIPRLIGNAVPASTLCLLLDEEEVPLALNVMHGEIFNRDRRIHIAIIGHGTVGGALIDQLIAQREQIRSTKGLDLSIFAIANSKQVLLAEEGIGAEWREQVAQAPKYPAGTTSIDQIIHFAHQHHLENTMLVDNTASGAIPKAYPTLVEKGFDLVSSNKIFNIGPLKEYQDLRQMLKTHRKSYRYEANVGAGLPLIDNLRLLHLSGDRITRIRGLFSGSLSYIFNQLSTSPTDFIQILQNAMTHGYTEPDPRIDLSGMDVARKVLILARELDVPCELQDVVVQNLVPPELQGLPLQAFWQRLDTLAHHIQTLQPTKEGEVLRYVGELNLEDPEGGPRLSCQLEAVPQQHALGRVEGADSCFEIYTESYGILPMVIQGAGAGAAVTARGVFSDILKISEHYDH